MSDQFYHIDWGPFPVAIQLIREVSFTGVNDQRDQGIEQPRTGARSGNYHFEGPSREPAEQIASHAKGTPVFSYPPKGFKFQTDSSRIHGLIVLFLSKAYEAKEDSFRRRIGTFGTGANVWPTLGDTNFFQGSLNEQSSGMP